MKIAGRELPFEKAVEYLSTYRERTIFYYDFGGGDEIQPSDGVTLGDIGRLALINARISGVDAARLLDTRAPWEVVPPHSELASADPSVSGGLYDSAEELYRHFTNIVGIKDAKASKLLHIKRPYLYPVLDKEVRDVYQGAAEKAARSLAAAREGKFMYWAAIREDVLGAETELKELRTRVAASNPRTSNLPAVRMLDILAWSLARDTSVA